jgi:type IV secretory pathway VirD2 relaxase
MSDNRSQFEIKVPRRSTKKRDDILLVSSAYRRAIRLLHASNCKKPLGKSSSRGKAKGRGLPNSSPMHHLQRASIRLTYARNMSDGQWGAHGRYLARESANPAAEGGFGFGSAGDHVPMVGTLDRWQRQRDASVFKFILSPEFGERMDMRQYARELVGSLEKDLGVSLEWVGIDHFNTGHPHVHLAVRGVTGEGQPLRIDPKYIKTTMRLRARQVATMQLGHRTDQDISDAWSRQVDQQRFTELDRIIFRRSLPEANGNLVVDFNGRLPVRTRARELRVQQIRRLVHLERMGLAERLSPMKWRVNPSLQSVLRQRQMATDRLKVRFRNREFLSDERLPIRQTDMRSVGRVSGRLIGTGLDEQTERPYVLVESVEGVVHYIHQSPDTIKARSRGLKTGSYVELTSMPFVGIDGVERTGVKFRSLGNSQTLIKDQRFLTNEVQRIVETTGTLPTEQGFGGWLGDYQRALRSTAQDLVHRGVFVRGEDGKFLFNVADLERMVSVSPHVGKCRHPRR